jgi:hypothetical protein
MFSKRLSNTHIWLVFIYKWRWQLMYAHDIMCHFHAHIHLKLHPPQQILVLALTYEAGKLNKSNIIP